VSGAFAADYYDGRISARRAVQVVVDAGRVGLRGEELALDYEASELRYRPRIAGAPINVDLPDGGLLVAPFEDLEKALPVPHATDLAHRLEAHVLLVLVSIAGLAVAGWLLYRDGIPWLAQKATQRLPAAVEADIARRGLPILDAVIFHPTRLPDDVRRPIQASFDRLAALQGGAGPRLEFRDGGRIGANAIAIPGGVIVVTDQLVQQLEDNDLVAAVLAHELGHLRHRHGTQRILRGSMVGLLSAAILGDVASVGNLAAVIPTALVDSSYSREFEAEADEYAFDLLRRAQLSPALLGDALSTITNEKAKPMRGGYLLSHPATADRIRAAEQAARK
jgi:Zn-dependent protease with chaperone function